MSGRHQSRGDFQDLREDREALGICTKLSCIYSAINALELLNLTSLLEEITQQLDDWEEDSQSSQFDSPEKQDQGCVDRANQFHSCLDWPIHTLPHDSILDANGVQLGNFGGVMNKIYYLKAENNRIKTRLDSMQADGIWSTHHHFGTACDAYQ